jgi:2-polyprenyl-3-methyl-5-hydroxy-6-metoxy-1,4-benzoquinol methylase
MGEEANASYYDELHASPDANVPAAQTVYYKLFCRVVAEVQARGITSVLEVGSGTGGLAEMLTTRTPARYCGFDFSPVSVRNAIARIGRSDAFFVGDATDPASYRSNYDGVVCTEVLEHVGRDLDVVAMWRPGVQCICSVPNFDDPSHVRHFLREEEVRERYGALIDIDRIVKIGRPLLRGRTLREYLRRLRWARESPKRMLGMLGINTFDWYAGWFLFAGRRKSRP